METSDTSEKMKWKLPQLEKACCCIPLRRGIIFLVYINLILLILAGGVFVVFDIWKWFLTAYSSELEHNRAIIFMFIFMVGVVIEVIMTIAALVGLHKKDLKVIRAYYYYTVVYTLFTAATRAADFQIEVWPFETLVSIVYFHFKFYYILMLRSQVKKMEKKKREQNVELQHVCVTQTDAKSEPLNVKEKEEDFADANLTRVTDYDDTIRLIEDDAENNIRSNAENLAKRIVPDKY